MLFRKLRFKGSSAPMSAYGTVVIWLVFIERIRLIDYSHEPFSMTHHNVAVLRRCALGHVAEFAATSFAYTVFMHVITYVPCSVLFKNASSLGLLLLSFHFPKCLLSFLTFPARGTSLHFAHRLPLHNLASVSFPQDKQKMRNDFPVCHLSSCINVSPVG